MTENKIAMLKRSARKAERPPFLGLSGNDPYIGGFNAHQAGTPMAKNPYRHPRTVSGEETESIAALRAEYCEKWELGWREADRDGPVPIDQFIRLKNTPPFVGERVERERRKRESK